MESISINRSQIYNDEYRFLGSGSEGEVYKYSSTIAFKIFPELLSLKNKIDEINLKRIAKIRKLMQLEDENFCFPKGFIKDQDNRIIGYYMELVKEKAIFDLNFTNDLKNKLAYYIAASCAIKRIHQKGVAIGDIRESNILMNNHSKIKFIDTDNFAYQGYSYSLADIRTEWLSKVYEKEYSLMDNDKYVLALLSLSSLCGEMFFNRQNPAFFKKLIASLNVSKYVKDGIEEILSDKPNKPYIGDFLEEIDPQEEILSLKAKRELRRYRFK